MPAAAATAACSTACSTYGHTIRVDRAPAPRGTGEAVRFEFDEGYRAALTPDEAEHAGHALIALAAAVRVRNARAEA